MELYQNLLPYQTLLKNLSNSTSLREKTRKKELILVVDDTSTNLKLVSDFLKEAGFEVWVAKSGVQALNIMNKALPDLILLDVVMPLMDGFETCRRLKAEEQTKDIPVIFMTAVADFANPENKIKGLTLGAVDYISKPIQLEEVLARVKTHLYLRSLTQQLQAQNILLAQEIQERKRGQEKLRTSEARLLEAQRVAHVGCWEFDVKLQKIIWSEELFHIFGLDPTQPEPPLAEHIKQIHPDDQRLWQKTVRRALKSAESYHFEFRAVRPDGSIRYLEGRGEALVNQQGQVIKLFGTALDITERKQAEILLAGQNSILELIASEVPLEQILDALARLVESQSGKMRCSFLLLDDKGRLHLGAAPSLPEGYSRAIDGVKIGPNVGSCGAAVYRKATVIVEDIASDALWADFKDLALSYGLRACWSTPILATDGTVLGTFAGYYTQPQKASKLDRDLISQTLYLAKIAIERQRQQAGLRQSKERLQLALDGSDLGLWDWNLATGEVYFDSQWKTMLGYEIDEIENSYQAWEQLVHPEDLPEVTTFLNAYLEGLFPIYDVEFRMRTKSGNWKWLLAHGKVFERDTMGKPLRMAGTNRDISDRKLKEAALHQRQQEFIALVENSPDIVARLDRNLRYLYINPVAEKESGIPCEAFIGKSYRDLGFPQETVSILEQGAKFVFETGQEHTVELSIPSPQGLRFYQSRLVPEKAPDGSIKSILTITRDITQLKNSEVRERSKAQELEQTLIQLKQTQSQLIQAEKISALGRMVAGVAHEINNPVSFIYGNLTYAQEYFQDLNDLVELYQKNYPNSTPEIQERIEEIDLEFLVSDWPKLISSMRFGAERIEQIVHSLQLFSRLNEAELKSVDIHEGIDNSILILQHRLQAQGSHPEIQLIKNYGQLPRITCYASQLNQVLMHLLNNAIDVLQESDGIPTITISTQIINHPFNSENSSLHSATVMIRIADNGQGMNEEVQQRIFDPFFTTKPVGQGTGLGLAISHQIVVEKHKGKISCISAIGQGTEFIVEIPVMQEESL